MSRIVTPEDDEPYEVLDRVYVMNGGVYDAAYVAIVWCAWPMAEWGAAPGIVARTSGSPAIARVEGTIVALLSCLTNEPPSTRT